MCFLEPRGISNGQSSFLTGQSPHVNFDAYDPPGRWTTTFFSLNRTSELFSFFFPRQNDGIQLIHEKDPSFFLGLFGSPVRKVAGEQATCSHVAVVGLDLSPGAGQLNCQAR